MRGCVTQYVDSLSEHLNNCGLDRDTLHLGDYLVNRCVFFNVQSVDIVIKRGFTFI